MAEVVAIVGSRTFPHRELVRRVIERLAQNPVTIISGGAPGVDTFAREACRDFGFHFCNDDPNDPDALKHLPLPHHFYEFLADWDGPRGKLAGLDRNTTIVRHSTRVIAFLAPGPPTSGTSDTIRKAKRAGLPTHVFHNGRWE